MKAADLNGAACGDEALAKIPEINCRVGKRHIDGKAVAENRFAGADRELVSRELVCAEMHRPRGNVDFICSRKRPQLDHRHSSRLIAPAELLQYGKSFERPRNY